MKRIALLIGLSFCFSQWAEAQPDRWQQGCNYVMEIDFDVEKHQFKGKQRLTYVNNSPDELHRVFYHLYFNAFQPGSMMDVRSRNILDPDSRVGDRISKLQPDEIGYHKVLSLKQNGRELPTENYEVVGTILEVTLAEPIKANSRATFDMEFESQVPVQVRRSGRNSAEGIDYSMSQWYPKMCEYDYQGWHANPYIGREFHGIWGDFDVKISIDKKYIIGASGYLQNPLEIGHGYEEEGQTVKRPDGDKLTWHFKAPNVHDFAWGADPDYVHDKLKVHDDLTMHFFYQPGSKTNDVWKKLQPTMKAAIGYMDKHYGKYPYKQYSFIQGGDGGMEYPMCTLITGERPFGSLVGVSVHEWMHSWYQMILGTNEALYAWMDEGFTVYGSSEVMNFLRQEGLIPGEPETNPHRGNYMGYINLAQSGLEEPLTTHADHFRTNFGYSMASYVKGAVFLKQLEYVVGEEAFDKGLLDYFETWKFKHPNTNDFIRVMEKASGMELDWYKEYWVQTTKTIDYAVAEVGEGNKGKTRISLKKLGDMPMPIDVLVTEKSGKQYLHHIPLRIMRGEKAQENAEMDYTVQEDWPWTNPDYEFEIECKLKKVVKVEIAPGGRLADMDPTNNAWEKE